MPFQHVPTGIPPISPYHPSNKVKKRRSQWHIGVDLGTRQDYTAIAVIQLRWHHDDSAKNVYHLRALERLPLGTPYMEQAERIRQVYALMRERGFTQLAVDATGVGEPVTELLRGCYPTRVTITGGSQETQHEFRRWSVPKRELASLLQVSLEQQRLKIASGLQEAGTLRDELQSFKVKMSSTGHDRYEHEQGAHDDTVIATALALWSAKRMCGGRAFLIE